MATHSFYSYSAQALVFDPGSGSFMLDPNFDHREDRNYIEVTDDDAFLDGDDDNEEVGEDASQTGVVRDGDGNIIGSGQIYAEEYAVIEAPDGSQISLDRIEINGVHMGYVPSSLLQPGVQYTYLGGSSIDDGGDPDGSGGTTPDNRAGYDYYETNSVPCFCSGTMIETETGLLPVDWISTQDRVRTLDHGFQKVEWIGHARLPLNSLIDKPGQWPVIISAGALGDGRPSHDLKVSPDHRILLSSPQIENLFGCHQVFVPAKALINGDTVKSMRPTAPVGYFHILCKSHEILCAENQWSESFFTGDQALGRLSPKDRDRLEAVLTEDMRKMKTARKCLTVKEAALVRDLLPKRSAAPVLRSAS